LSKNNDVEPGPDRMTVRAGANLNPSVRAKNLFSRFFDFK
jgi:hypothetical protein